MTPTRVEIGSDGRGTVIGAGRRWPFELDLAGPAAVLRVPDGRRIRVRSLTWGEKAALSRFASHGPALLARAVATACVTGGRAGGPPDEVVARLVAWLEDPAVPPADPTLDPVAVAAISVRVCRATGLGPAALDALPAGEVTSMWEAVELDEDEPEPVGNWPDATRIIVVEDAGSGVGAGATAPGVASAPVGPMGQSGAASPARRPVAGRPARDPAAGGEGGVGREEADHDRAGRTSASDGEPAPPRAAAPGRAVVDDARRTAIRVRRVDTDEPVLGTTGGTVRARPAPDQHALSAPSHAVPTSESADGLPPAAAASGVPSTGHGRGMATPAGLLQAPVEAAATGAQRSPGAAPASRPRSRARRDTHDVSRAFRAIPQGPGVVATAAATMRDGSAPTGVTSRPSPRPSAPEAAPTGLAGGHDAVPGPSPWPLPRWVADVPDLSPARSDDRTWATEAGARGLDRRLREELIDALARELDAAVTAAGIGDDG